MNLGHETAGGIRRVPGSEHARALAHRAWLNALRRSLIAPCRERCSSAHGVDTMGPRRAHRRHLAESLPRGRLPIPIEPPGEPSAESWCLIRHAFPAIQSRGHPSRPASSRPPTAARKARSSKPDLRLPPNPQRPEQHPAREKIKGSGVFVVDTAYVKVQGAFDTAGYIQYRYEASHFRIDTMPTAVPTTSSPRAPAPPRST